MKVRVVFRDEHDDLVFDIAHWGHHHTTGDYEFYNKEHQVIVSVPREIVRYVREDEPGTKSP